MNVQVRIHVDLREFLFLSNITVGIFSKIVTSVWGYIFKSLDQILANILTENHHKLTTVIPLLLIAFLVRQLGGKTHPIGEQFYFGFILFLQT